MSRAELRLLPKAALFVLVSGAYLLLSFLYRALFSASPRLRRAVLIRHASFFAGLMLWSLGIRVAGERIGGWGKGDRFLVVSNHLSYIDVLVILAARPAVFVTSYEVRDAFFLGSMAKGAGSLFVERRKRSWLKGEIGEISRVLDEGHCVVIFPEATTSDGAGVLPFKMALLDSAVRSRVDVLPLCIAYTELNGRPFPPDKEDGKRDIVCFHSRAAFLPHLLRLLGARSIGAKLTVLETIPVQSDSSRKELAQTAFQAIDRCYAQILFA